MTCGPSKNLRASTPAMRENLAVSYNTADIYHAIVQP
jgi:hypothetical protein